MVVSVILPKVFYGFMATGWVLLIVQYSHNGKKLVKRSLCQNKQINNKTKNFKYKNVTFVIRKLI